MSDSSELVKSDVDFECPFCSSLCNATKDSEKGPCVMHEMPPCDTFNDMDPIEFMIACNNKFGAKRE